MSVIAAALKHMLAAGMPHDAILQAVEDMERGLQVDEQAERRRAADRERKRAKRPLISADSADSADIPRASVTRVEDKTSTQKIEPQEQEERKKDPPNGDLVAFRAELSPFLDTERLDAIVKHRRSKRAQSTAHAARLFLRDAEACGLSVADAVDTCISRNWVTVKPEYNIGQPRGSPAPQPKPKLANGFGRIADQMRQQREIRSGESGPSLPAPVPNLSLVSGGR